MRAIAVLDQGREHDRTDRHHGRDGGAGDCRKQRAGDHAGEP